MNDARWAVNPLIQPKDSHLTWNQGHPGDLWSATVPVPFIPGTHFARRRLYLYRFQLEWAPSGGVRQLTTRWVLHLFAQLTDVWLRSPLGNHILQFLLARHRRSRVHS
jgi:hypothetical protein